MVYFDRLFKVDDNSGANLFKSFKVLKRPSNSLAYVGDILVGSVKSVIYRKMKRKKRPLKKGVYYAILVRDLKGIRRNNLIIFSKKAGVVLILKDTLLPIGNRILSSVFLELRLKGFFKILMLAKYII